MNTPQQEESKEQTLTVDTISVSFITTLARANLEISKQFTERNEHDLAWEHIELAEQLINLIDMKTNRFPDVVQQIRELSVDVLRVWQK